MRQRDREAERGRKSEGGTEKREGKRGRKREGERKRGVRGR